jgi:hypothetical protein
MKHGCNKKGKIHTLYSRWASMKQRCYNPKHTGFKNYGARGIIMCDRWKDFKNFFEDILSEIGDCPGKGYTLDRINNDGNYEPGNIKWSTWKEQLNNRRPIHKPRAEVKRCTYCGRFLGKDHFRLVNKEKEYRSSRCKRCDYTQRSIWKLDNVGYRSKLRREKKIKLQRVLDRYNVVSKEMGLSEVDTFDIVLDHFLHFVKKETEQR